MADTKKAPGRPKAFDRDFALEKALRVFWEKGYVSASMTELCSAMGINAPSLYAEFGNKKRLFLEALEFYEKKYWEKPALDFLKENDIRRAVRRYFEDAAEILCSQETPCGCMTVSAALCIPSEEEEIRGQVCRLRDDTQAMFAEALEKAVRNGQLSEQTDVLSLSLVLNTLLEGLSVQTKNGAAVSDLRGIPLAAVRILG